MQLQGSLAQYEAAGIAVIAISPDTVAELAEFALAHGITYPLLSDADSSVIRAYGILNTLLDETDEDYGIPYPGSYMVGRDGRVEEKSFYREYQVRETALTTLRTGFGVAPDDPSASADGSTTPSAEVVAPGVRIRAALGAIDMSFMQEADLYVTLALDDDLHVYGHPIPDGYQAVDVRVTAPEGVRIGEAVQPATQPMRIAGLDEDFNVMHGDPLIRIPIVFGVQRAEDFTDVELRIEVRYQACTDSMCFAPTRANLLLRVPLAE